MRVYLDNCCYNRPYDNQGQLAVRLETEAKLRVQHLMRIGALTALVGHVGMERFIVLLNREPHDYTKWRETHFCDDGETLEQLAEKIKAYVPPRRRTAVAPV